MFLNRILSEATSIITPAWYGGQMVQVVIIEIVSIVASGGGGGGGYLFIHLF